MGELHVEERGEGFPLLLVQGLGYANWAWRFQLDGLSQGRRVIAFDNRGTGRSFKPPGPYTIAQLADDAAAVLEGLGVERADVLGHSMGGYIAQTLALRHPELVRSLILSGTGAGPPSHEAIPDDTLRQWLDSAHLPPAEYVRKTMHLSFRRGWPEANPELWEELIAARLEFPTPPEAWRAQFDACVAFVQEGSPVEGIRVPTLVLHGDDDRVVPVANGRGLARRIPGAELREFPGGGHNLMLEAAEDFNGAVEEFLRRVETADPVHAGE